MPPVSLQANAEPRPRSKGFYAEAGIGGRGYLADAGESSAIGPNASLHLGIDLFSWFSVGGQLGASSHEATVPAPPVGEYYQLYSAAGEARLSIPVGPLAVFADGRAGLAMVSTNILEKSAILDPASASPSCSAAAAGLEYQLQNRHYAFGVAGSYTLLPAYDASSSVSARFLLALHVLVPADALIEPRDQPSFGAIGKSRKRRPVAANKAFA